MPEASPAVRGRAVHELMVHGLVVHGLQGLPEVRAGDDLSALLLRSAATLPLRAGDVVVVSSKLVSKAAGLTRPAARRDDVVDEQTVRVVARRRTPRGVASIVQAVAGPVMAAAGVDASNAPAGRVLVLPADADRSARELRAALRAGGAPLVAVVVTDTAGRAWRTGQTDFALGCAGLPASQDLRGTLDASGTPLEVTERAVVDEIAAAADLVKGKARGVPAAVVRGLADLVTDDDGPGAAALLRDPASDWFRLGHVEAVRQALGVAPGAVEAPSVLPEPPRHRAARALDVALRGAAELACDAAVDDDGTVTLVARDGFDAGLATGRLLAALWSEDLAGSVAADRATHRVVVTVSPTTAT